MVNNITKKSCFNISNKKGLSREKKKKKKKIKDIRNTKGLLHEKWKDLNRKSNQHTFKL